MHIVTASVEKATINGVHNIHKVRNALETAISAVKYAKGLGLLAPDIFRPALDKALHQSALAREAVDAAAALKQHEAQQRAQLGGDLDSGKHTDGHPTTALMYHMMRSVATACTASAVGRGERFQSSVFRRSSLMICNGSLCTCGWITGRARLGRVQEGCNALTVDKAALESAAKTALAAIETCCDELLVVAQRETAAAMVLADDNSGGSYTSGVNGQKGRRSSLMQRTFTRAAMLIEQSSSSNSNGSSSAAVNTGTQQSDEVDLEHRRETCAKALHLVAVAEDLYAQLRCNQNALEQSRAAAQQQLADARTAIAGSQRIAAQAGITDVAAVQVRAHGTH